jgi:hypothetical protein
MVQVGVCDTAAVQWFQMGPWRGSWDGPHVPLCGPVTRLPQHTHTQGDSFQELYAAFREAMRVTEDDLDAFAVSEQLCCWAVAWRAVLVLCCACVRAACSWTSFQRLRCLGADQPPPLLSLSPSLRSRTAGLPRSVLTSCGCSANSAATCSACSTG